MKLHTTVALALTASLALAQEKTEEVARIIPPQPVAEPSITTTPEQIAEAQAKVEAVENWVKDFLVTHAPPGRKLWYPNAQETEEEGAARYDSVATDIVLSGFSPNTKTPFMQRDSGRSRLVAVWLGVMLHESGFMRNVDFNLGKYGRGDEGKSWCLMQLRIGTGRTQPWNVAKNRRPYWGDPPEEIKLGYTGSELIADRKLCLQEGHKLVWASFKSCEDRPLEDRLTSYAVGFCEEPKDDPKKLKLWKDGLIKSQIRMKSGVNWYERSKYQRNWKDPDIVKAVELLSTSMKQTKLAATAAAQATNPLVASVP